MDDKKRSGLVVLAASIIACIRHKGADLRRCPLLTSTVNDAVNLAQLIVSVEERKT